MVEYPQIIAKEGKEIFCGANKINERLEGLSYWQDYNILYADRYYISLWCDDKGGKGRTYFLICSVRNSMKTIMITGTRRGHQARYPCPLM